MNHLSSKPTVLPPPRTGRMMGSSRRASDAANTQMIADPVRISPIPKSMQRRSYKGIPFSATNNKMRREFSRENLMDAFKHGHKAPAFGPSKAALGLINNKSSAAAALLGAAGAGGDPSPPVSTPTPEERSAGADEDGEEGEGDGSARPCPSWSEIGWDPSLSREDLVGCVYDLMLRLLTDAVGREYASGDRWEVLKSQLRSFVDRVSALYRPEPRFHNWGHACHVVQAAEFLARKSVERQQPPSTTSDEKKETSNEEDGDFDGDDDSSRLPCIPPIEDPWLPFVAVFCALVHDARHLGVTNRHLESKNHLLCQMYDRGSCQERRSLHVGLGVFAEEFPELSGEVLSCCPSFVRLVRSAVLATDISSADVQRTCKEKFARALESSAESSADGGAGPGNGEADAGAGPVGGLGEQSESLRAAEEERIRTEATLEHILLLADVGHCSQGYDTFLRWNHAFFEECAENWDAGRGDFDPRKGWYEGQIGFMENYIAPLAERCERLMPKGVELRGGVEDILERWRAEGEEWTEQMIEEHRQHNDGATQLSE